MTLLLTICQFYISCRLQGKSQIVQDELVKLGEQMVHSAEGTKALALELCREFEDRFLQHITTGEVRYDFLCTCFNNLEVSKVNDFGQGRKVAGLSMQVLNCNSFAGFWMEGCC